MMASRTVLMTQLQLARQDHTEALAKIVHLQTVMHRAADDLLNAYECECDREVGYECDSCSIARILVRKAR